MCDQDALKFLVRVKLYAIRYPSTQQCEPQDEQHCEPQQHEERDLQNPGYRDIQMGLVPSSGETSEVGAEDPKIGDQEESERGEDGPQDVYTAFVDLLKEYKHRK